MTPEERQKWLENSKRWKNMTKEERQVLRLQATLRTQRMEKAVDELIRKNGWNISPELRQQLLSRYMDERQKVEDNLRKEIEEKRRAMIGEMLEKLKAEFSPIAAAEAAPASSSASTAHVQPKTTGTAGATTSQP